jgi:hypothetical protein
MTLCMADAAVRDRDILVQNGQGVAPGGKYIEIFDHLTVG